jgi:hypothetical protein
VTGEQLQILQHALDVDQYGQGEMYRNHFCAGGKDEDVCRELVAMVYMRVFHPNQSPLPYYNCSVTDSGKQAMLTESPRPPKLTAGQRRYQRFLDEDSGLSFGEWLALERK